MKYIILSLAFFLISPLLYCQEKDYVQQVIEENFSKIDIPTLSQSEMYADFDTVSFLLKNVYPYYYIKSQLNATNYDEKLLELRNQISNIQQTSDFIWILQKALNLFCDDHLAIPLSLSSFYKTETEYIFKFGTNFTPENIVRTHKYSLLTRDSLQVKIKLGMRFKYLDGKYYSYRAFKYKNQIYPEGIVLKSINGMPIDTFVNQFYAGMLLETAYDYKNKKYFSNFFFVSPDFFNKNTHILVFEDDKRNILQDTFFVNVQVENLSKKQPPQNYTPAVFTVFDSILYVRMPYMDGDVSFFTNEIQKLYKTGYIRKIIIDVRENPGGSDLVWKDVLSSIIADTLRTNVALYAPNVNEQVKDFLKRRNGANQTEYLPLLNVELLNVFKKQDIISPNENSIRFGGKIVILQDENTFSAAGSLVTLAKENDNIITIGYNMNDIGGRGIGTRLFQLPHTNMLFCMPLVIDYSSVNQMSDFLRNIPQIECERSISSFLKSYYSTNSYLLESLLQDECFLKAISL